MLFTFPSRYWFAIGLRKVFSLAGWSPQIHTGFLVSRATQDTANLDKLARTGPSPSAAPLSSGFRFAYSRYIAVLQPPARLDAPGLGSSAFARHYSRNHCYFLFLGVVRCFSSPRSPPHIRRVPCLQHGGLPHSEIRASTAICASTRLFAAYHVLLRLPEPRHPPSALIRFFYVSYLYRAEKCPARLA